MQTQTTTRTAYPIHARRLNELRDYLRHEHDLQDAAVLGGRIDGDLAEIAEEFGVTLREAYRALDDILHEA